MDPTPRVTAVTRDGMKLDIKLYGLIGSQPARAIKTLLEIGNLKHEYINVMDLGGLDGEEWLKINPKRAVPLVVINGKNYRESAATLRLLANEFPCLQSYYPEDVFQRHTIDAALDFNGTTFRPLLMARNMAFFAQRGNNSEISRGIQMKIDEANKQVNEGMVQLEEMLRNRRTKFLAGDDASIADVQLFTQSTDLFWHQNSWADFPYAIDWRNAMYEIPGVKKVYGEWREFVGRVNCHVIPSGPATNLPLQERQAIDEIVEYWYPPQDFDRHMYVSTIASKHQNDKMQDQIIIDKYSQWFDKISNRKLEHWQNDHYGRLALIILCDQMGRMMFRGKSKAFSLDDKAFGIATAILDNQNMKGCYRHQEILSILFPLFHKEDENSIQRCFDEAYDLERYCDKAGDLLWKSKYEDVMKYSMKQEAMLKEYGRFPYRNQALGRRNTPEEEEFLKNRNM